MSTTKIGKNNQYFEQLFFMINLHFGTSNNYLHVEKKNLRLINSIFWSSLENEEDWYRPKYTTIFLLSLKRNNSQTFKTMVTAIKVFSIISAIGTTCFDIYSLFRMITGRHCFLKFIITLKYFATVMFLLSLTKMIWNKAKFFYLHNTNSKVKL